MTPSRLPRLAAEAIGNVVLWLVLGCAHLLAGFSLGRNGRPASCA